MGRRQWRKYQKHNLSNHHPNFESLLQRAQDNDPDLVTIDLRCENTGTHFLKRLSRALEQNHIVKELWLGCNNVDDEGAMSIAPLFIRNSSIKTLWIGNNCIGSSGIVSLANALSSNTTLTVLDLHSNKLGDDGARSVARLLESNHALRWIDLRDNSIEDEGASAICHSLDLNGTVTEIILNRWEDGRHERNEISASRLESSISEKLTFNGSKAPEIAHAVKTWRYPEWLIWGISEVSVAALPAALERISHLEGGAFVGGDPDNSVHPGRLCECTVSAGCVLSIIFSFVVQKHANIMSYLDLNSSKIPNQLSSGALKDDSADTFDLDSPHFRLCSSRKKCGCGLCMNDGDLCCIHANGSHQMRKRRFCTDAGEHGVLCNLSPWRECVPGLVCSLCTKRRKEGMVSKASQKHEE